MIYFIQDDTLGHIKIGFTEQEIGDRMSALQTGSPVGLVLLLTMPGDQDVEDALHQRFDSLHLRGEWFFPGPALIGYLLSIAAAPSEALVVEVKVEPLPEATPTRTVEEMERIDSLNAKFAEKIKALKAMSGGATS